MKHECSKEAEIKPGCEDSDVSLPPPSLLCSLTMVCSVGFGRGALSALSRAK